MRLTHPDWTSVMPGVWSCVVSDSGDTIRSTMAQLKIDRSDPGAPTGFRRDELVRLIESLP